MRAKLVRSVAPILFVSAALPMTGANAQDAGLARCSAIADITARLECFDALSRARGAAPQSPPATARAAAPVPSVAAADPVDRVKQKRAKFGLSAVQIKERLPKAEQDEDRLTTVVASTRPFGAGYWTIVTRDGQTWRVTEARQSFRPPQNGDTVVLRRASMGSFLLVAENQPGIRAKRLS